MNDIERAIKKLENSYENKAIKSHILTYIHNEKIWYARLQVWLFGILSVFSLLSIIPSIAYLNYEINSSGLGQYFSLLFSDVGTVTLHFYPYLMSVIDSTPFTGIALTLIALMLTISFYRKLSERVTLINQYKLFELNS